MIVVAGTIRVPPEKIAEAKPHIERVITGSRAEPGCVIYSFGFDVLEEGLIRVFEVYRDQAALEAHRNSDHFKAWRVSNPGIGAHDRQITVYQVSDAQKVS